MINLRKKIIPVAYLLLISSQFLHPINIPTYKQNNTVYSLNETATPATTHQNNSTTSSPIYTPENITPVLTSPTATPTTAILSLATSTLTSTALFTTTPTTTPTSTPTSTSAATYIPTSTLTPTSIPTYTPTPTFTPVSTPTVQPTNTPVNYNVTIEGWFKGDRNEARDDFKIDVYEGYNSNPVVKTATNPNGYFKLSFNTNTKYTLKVYKPDSKYMPRVYKLSLIGNFSIGSLSKPEVIHWGDLNNDEIVNIADIIVVSGNFGRTSSSTSYNKDADLNSDGVINMNDIMKLSNIFSATPENQTKAIYLESDAETCYEPSGWYSMEDTSLNLKGYTLKINGSLVFKSSTLINSTGSSLNINGGTLEILNDLNFGQPGYNDSLIMTKEEGKLIVGKGFIFATAVDHEGILTAGTIVIKGDYFNVNDDSNNKAFYCTKNHKILLSGSHKKVIKLSSDDPLRNRRVNIIIVPKNYEFEIWPRNAYNSILDLPDDAM